MPTQKCYMHDNQERSLRLHVTSLYRVKWIGYNSCLIWPYVHEQMGDSEEKSDFDFEISSHHDCSKNFKIQQHSLFKSVKCQLNKNGYGYIVYFTELY